jgi:AAA domain
MIDEEEPPPFTAKPFTPPPGGGTPPPPGGAQQPPGGAPPPPKGAASQFPQPHFRTLKEFCAEYVPLAEVVEGVIMSGSLYTMTATTGTGKTAFLTTTTLAGASGRDLLGPKVQRGRYAICTAENPDGVKMRLSVACFHWRLDQDAIGRNLLISDNRVRPEEICEYLTREATNGPFTGIFIDTWQAFFDGQNASNPTEAVNFTRRFRPLTFLSGSPAVVVCAHPNKNASNDELIPGGGGSTLNEVDGNLTLAMQPNGLIELGWQGKFRGFHFEPRLFRIENLSSPDIVDIKGKQIAIPIMFSATVEEAASREAAIANREMRLLKAIAENPGAPVTDLAVKATIPRGSVDRAIKRLAKERPKLIQEHLGKWKVTKAGKAVLEGELVSRSNSDNQNELVNSDNP